MTVIYTLNLPIFLSKISLPLQIVHKLLKELANQDLSLFAQIVTDLDEIKTYKKSPIPSEHIDAYLEFYNFLRDKFFSELSYVIMPYSKMHLGVIFIGNSPVMFRSCTPPYPQTYIQIDDKNLIQQLAQGPINKYVYQDLKPMHVFHIGGIHEFSEYPQKASYEHLLSEVSSALSKGLLNESCAPDILRERVYDILLSLSRV